jgi:hypothetical protein
VPTYKTSRQKRENVSDNISTIYQCYTRVRYQNVVHVTFINGLIFVNHGKFHCTLLEYEFFYVNTNSIHIVVESICSTMIHIIILRYKLQTSNSFFEIIMNLKMTSLKF